MSTAPHGEDRPTLALPDRSQSYSQLGSEREYSKPISALSIRLFSGYISDLGRRRRHGPPARVGCTLFLVRAGAFVRCPNHASIVKATQSTKISASPMFDCVVVRAG